MTKIIDAFAMVIFWFGVCLILPVAVVHPEKVFYVIFSVLLSGLWLVVTTPYDGRS